MSLCTYLTAPTPDVCMYVCMYGCVCVCMYVYVCVCMYVCICMYVCVRMYVCNRVFCIRMYVFCLCVFTERPFPQIRRVL